MTKSKWQTTQWPKVKDRLQNVNVKKRFWDTKRDICRGVIADAVSNKKNDFVALFIKVILHQFWMKKIFPWKFNLEYSGTFTNLFMYVSSRNMFPTTRNLQIRVHVYRPRHYCGDWLTFGCFVPMIVDHDLVKKVLVQWLPIMTSGRKDKQSWILR
jgi:hypothetical protein